MYGGQESGDWLSIQNDFGEMRNAYTRLFVQHMGGKEANRDF
jgi:hypothetical protein